MRAGRGSDEEKVSGMAHDDAARRGRGLPISGRVELGRVDLSIRDAATFAIEQRLAYGEPDAELLARMLPAIERGDLRFPVIPETVARVMRLLESARVELTELAALIELDPALATKVVGVSNSAYYGAVAPVSSVHQAVMRMGLLEARNIVTAVLLRSTVFNVGALKSRAEEQWRHALLTAVAADQILREVAPFTDAGFLLGLVHDVGRLLVLAFAARDARGEPVPEEALDLACDSMDCVLGALTVRSWDFPDDFVHVIAHHHDDAAVLEEGPRRTLCIGLQAADEAAWCIDCGAPSTAEEMPVHLAVAFELVGIDRERGMEVLASVEEGFAGLLKLM